MVPTKEMRVDTQMEVCNNDQELIGELKTELKFAQEQLEFERNKVAIHERQINEQGFNQEFLAAADTELSEKLSKALKDLEVSQATLKKKCADLESSAKANSEIYEVNARLQEKLSVALKGLRSTPVAVSARKKLEICTAVSFDKFPENDSTDGLMGMVDRLNELQNKCLEYQSAAHRLEGCMKQKDGLIRLLTSQLDAEKAKLKKSSASHDKLRECMKNLQNELGKYKTEANSEAQRIKDLSEQIETLKSGFAEDLKRQQKQLLERDHTSVQSSMKKFHRAAHPYPGKIEPFDAKSKEDPGVLAIRLPAKSTVVDLKGQSMKLLITLPGETLLVDRRSGKEIRMSHEEMMQSVLVENI